MHAGSAGVSSSKVAAGHQKITDVYLLALAFRNKGRLATFDRSISWKAVIGAEPRHLEFIAGSGPGGA